jgi:hypothetical protein
MALRDEISPKINRLDELEVWLKKQSNRKEWTDIIFDTQYSSGSVAKLLTKHGFKADWNLVYRFRERHAAK